MSLSDMRHSEREDEETLGQAHWRVQPLWVKWLICTTALPAWLVMVALIIAGEWQPQILEVCFWVFIPSSVISTFFIGRAYWRMDL
jgi:hypothetical protein